MFSHYLLPAVMDRGESLCVESKNKLQFFNRTLCFTASVTLLERSCSLSGVKLLIDFTGFVLLHRHRRAANSLKASAQTLSVASLIDFILFFHNMQTALVLQN